MAAGWLSVDWVSPLAAPTIMPACGPRRMSAAMSTMYDTDMFEPLAMGKWTLNADVSDERTMKKSSGGTGVSVGARHQRGKGDGAEDDDADRVPAGSRWKIPKHSHISIHRGRAGRRGPGG